MHCTVLIPGLLTAAAFTAEQYPHAGALEVMFARGDVALRPALERDAWLCDVYGVAKQNDWPVAPLMLRHDGIDPGNHFWLRADPVHLSVSRGQLILAGAIDDLGVEETSALTTALNHHFEPDGITIHAPRPQRWYLRTEHVPRIATTPLAQALQRSVDPHLPQGDDALAWHRLINEAQMILHAHPVNARREARGASPANSLWLWGGGIVSTITARPYEAVWGNDALAQSLALSAGGTAHPLPHSVADWFPSARGERHLLIFDGLEEAVNAGDSARWREHRLRLERDWAAPLLGALRTHQLEVVTFIVPTNPHLIEITTTRKNLRRWWRRKRPLNNDAGSVP